MRTLLWIVCALWAIPALVSVQARAQTPAVVCGASATPLHRVQGPGVASPLEGRVVQVEGAVTATFQDDPGDRFGRDLGGFFLEAPAAERDGNPATSEGVFVRTDRPVSVGRRVRVLGTVGENHRQTEIAAVGEVRDCGPATAFGPVPLELPPPGPLGLEPYEGRLVRLPQALTVAGTHDFDRYGEIVLALPIVGADLPLQPTHAFPADGGEAASLARAQEQHRIVLDDGRHDQNPSPPRHPNGRPFDLDNRFRAGDTVRDVVGALGYAFGAYRVQPTEGARVTATNPRPAAPPDVGGTLRIASWNVGNYFASFGSRCGPSGGMDCRGADGPAELRRQRAKLLSALVGLNADVVALQELQNDPRDAALRDLAAGLNEARGGWRYVPTGALGRDAIAQGLLYREDAVAPVGPPVVLDARAFLDPLRTGEARHRPALAQAFRDRASGVAFVVVVDHLKSKGSSCGPRDDDPLEGSCAATRVAGVRALLDWLADDPTGTGAGALLVGDLNAYPQEDAVRALMAGVDGRRGTADDLVDLVALHAGPQATTFANDGRFGRLDHAFATAGLADRVTGAGVWAIDAAEPDLIDYDLTFKDPAEAALYAPDPYRASDHDPVVVGLQLGPSRSEGR